MHILNRLFGKASEPSFRRVLQVTSSDQAALIFDIIKEYERDSGVSYSASSSETRDRQINKLHDLLGWKSLPRIMQKMHAGHYSLHDLNPQIVISDKAGKTNVYVLISDCELVEKQLAGSKRLPETIEQIRSWQKPSWLKEIDPQTLGKNPNGWPRNVAFMRDPANAYLAFSSPACP